MKANEEIADIIQRLVEFIHTNNRVPELSEDDQYQNLISLQVMAEDFKLSMTAGQKKGGAK